MRNAIVRLTSGDSSLNAEEFSGASSDFVFCTQKRKIASKLFRPRRSFGSSAAIITSSFKYIQFGKEKHHLILHATLH